jgi:4-amino-4-deoxy-L-arabinose transferase-like glycosyltransferase
MFSELSQTQNSPVTSVESSNILRARARKRWVPALLVLGFSFSLYFISSLGWELPGADDSRVAGIAREMAVTQDYLVPRLNGEPFLEYPPLGYYPIALSLWLFGKPVDFHAVLPIVLLGTGTVLLTFLIGRALGGERIALMAGLVLPTLVGFFSLYNHCLVDPALLFLITLSLYGFVAGYIVPGARFRSIALFYLGMSGGFLSKGLIGVGIPAGVATIYLIVKRDRHAIRKLRIGWGIFLFALPILLWAGGIGWFESPDYLKEIIRQSLWRFLSPSADHAAPFYYYLLPTMTHLLPWTPLLLIFLLLKNRSITPNFFHGGLGLFATIWFVTVFVGLSLSSAKRVLYLAPIYPSFALLAALAWDRVRNEFPRITRYEIWGIGIVYVLLICANFVFVLPHERAQGVRPVFEAVARESEGGPVYLLQPDEALRGAAFFYLGKRSPVLRAGEPFPEEFRNGSGTIVVVGIGARDNPPDADLERMGFRVRFRKGWKTHRSVLVYSNHP